MAGKPVVLSIAGYDPSSGAGITADVKTAAAMGCYAVTCITALTVQSTQGVFEVVPASPEVVRETLYRLFEDVEIAAVRIGMLGTAGVTRVVANFFRRYTHPNVVFDPVLRASSGTALLDEHGVEVVRKFLLRRVGVVTPNFEEVQVLAGESPLSAPDSWERTLPRARELAGKLDKANEVATSPSAMAVKQVFLCVDVERGMGLLMQRAESQELRPGANPMALPVVPIQVFQ